MSKHTPGPWVPYANDDRSSIGRPIHIHSASQAVVSSNTAIVKVYGRDMDPDERDANARLVCAAPELLAQLKLVREIGLLPKRQRAETDALIARIEGAA